MALLRFESLEVFKRAYAVSLDLHRASLAFPQVEQFGLADQLRRASKSISANIAEGMGKAGNSQAELRRYLQIAIGSADGMRVWLRYALDLGYVNADDWQRWRDEYEAIAKMLNGMCRQSKRRA